MIASPFTLLLALLLPLAWAAPPPALEPFTDGAEQVGYRDPRSKKVVIPPRFIQGASFSAEGLAVVLDPEGWAWIGTQGQLVARAFPFDNDADAFSEGRARYVEGKLLGFIDARGNKVIPARFVFVRPFAQGRAAFCEGCVAQAEGEYTRMVGGRWGYIDLQGKVAIPAELDSAEDFDGGRASARRAGAPITLDLEGKVVPTPQ